MRKLDHNSITGNRIQIKDYGGTSNNLHSTKGGNCFKFLKIRILMAMATLWVILSSIGFYVISLSNKQQQQQGSSLMASVITSSSSKEPSTIITVFRYLLSRVYYPCTTGSGNFTYFTLPNIATDEELFDGPGLLYRNTSRTATCWIWKNARDLNCCHLPHSMEQLYKCISWWYTNPTKQAVLVVRDYQYAKMKKQPFLDGLLKILQQVWNVTIVHHNQTDPAVEARKEPRLKVHSPLVLHHLRDTILKNIGTISNNSCVSGKPRIAILDRKGIRPFGDPQSLVLAITTKIANGTPVVIHYNEKKTFREQVEFFSKVDIVVSPHGAQLTGIPFMPRCGAVFELFPLGYRWEKYFGQLASCCELNYGYLYLSNKEGGLEWGTGRIGYMIRSVNRHVRVCPPPDKVADGVSKLVDEWKRCCSMSQS